MPDIYEVTHKISRLIIAAIMLGLFYQNIHAQTDNLFKPVLPESDTLRGYNLLEVIPDTEIIHFMDLSKFGSENLSKRDHQVFYDFNEPFFTNRLSFNQIKSSSELTGLGYYEHFVNNFGFEKDKFTFDLGFGLASQTTLLMTTPVYQTTFSASVKYAVTRWLNAYLYGQYVTKPFNKSNDYFDPFLHNNPLFLQSEIGGGLKTNFKKVNADLKIYSIYQNSSKKFSPVNSVFSIEF